MTSSDAGNWVNMTEHMTKYRIMLDRDHNGDVVEVTARIADTANDEMILAATKQDVTFKSYDNRFVIFPWEVLAVVLKEIQSGLGVLDIEEGDGT